MPDIPTSDRGKLLVRDQFYNEACKYNLLLNKLKINPRGLNHRALADNSFGPGMMT